MSTSPWPRWTPSLHMSLCCTPPCAAVSWERRCVLLAVVTGVDLLLATSEDLTAKYILLLIFCLLPHEWMGITQVSLDASVIL